MHRIRLVILLAGAMAWGGMTGDGCTGAGLLPRLGGPAIIPVSGGVDTLRHTFRIDTGTVVGAAMITWDFGDGAVMSSVPLSSARQVTHEYVRNETFVVTVHLFGMRDLVNGGFPHLASATLPVTVRGPNNEPLAAFSVQDTSSNTGTDQPMTKRFVASSSRDLDGTIVSYEWDFGDGQTGEGETVEHTYAVSGRFMVQLTITDDRGATAVQVRTVLANSAPTAAFTFSESGGNGLAFSFDASGSNDADGQITQFSWDFGDDSSPGSGQMVTHAYAVPGDFTVTLTVTDNLGTRTSTSQLLDVTGEEVFVRSISASAAEADTTITDVVIDGENFETGAIVTLEGPSGEVIPASSADAQSDTVLVVTFDLTGAAPGDYDVVVTNPGGLASRLEGAFRVVTRDLVRLTTSLGDIVIRLFPDEAPITTDNFLQYVTDDFYDGTVFHRVVPDFVVQGGGFLPNGDQPEGLRDPIQNEFDPARSNVRGTVAMAKLPNDPDSATSQFFFNLSDDNAANLDNQNGGFTVFAEVVEGQDVIDQIAMVELNGDVPVEDVVLIMAERE